MDIPVLGSTLFILILFFVGLFFFIRGSVKERPEEILLTSDGDPQALRERVQHYFHDRAYQIKTIDPQTENVTLEGLVRPSVFLAIFLTISAAIGLACFALVLVYLVPSSYPWNWSLIIFGAIAGWYYWQKAQRLEQVLLTNQTKNGQHFLTVQAHRDEINLMMRLAPWQEKS